MIKRVQQIAAALVVGAGSALTIAFPVQAAVETETAYIFNTFSFLFHGALVMWMAAGFAMLESGLARAKNTAAICLKNILLYSIAGLAFYTVGYSLMYTNVTGWLGSLALFYNSSPDELAMLQGHDEALAASVENSYSVMSDWFFQMVFVATAASIVSGTVAERIRIWPFLVFVLVLTAVVYPIQGSWTWGGGWLDKLGFSDFAGSTIVHSVGGWAALTGAIILGARTGKYVDGQVRPMPGSNLPLATLGTFVLWLGWFGFNGGSQLALGSASDAAAIAIIYANTNLAAAAGAVAAAIVAQLLYKKVDLTMVLNGAIAGLVSITANPALTNHMWGIVVGAIGGVLVVFAIPMFDRLRIDDVVGALSAHLVAGIWGTLAVAIFGDANLAVQVIGILTIGAFVSATSAIVWLTLKATIGLRANEEGERLGLDNVDLGVEAYPEFGRGSSLG